MEEESALDSALRHFEVAEANLNKLENILSEIEEAIPDGVAFGLQDSEYEDNCRRFKEVLKELPEIDGWKPDVEPFDLDAIAQWRFDAQEVGSLQAKVSVERKIEEPRRMLDKYRYRLDRKRRELIREELFNLLDRVDNDLEILADEIEGDFDGSVPVENPQFEELKKHVDQIDTLLGSSVDRPDQWSRLKRHLGFGELVDLRDIVEQDWPRVKEGLEGSIYGEKEPIPTDVNDLSDVVEEDPEGEVTTELMWEKLSANEFERLIFSLISAEEVYENPGWLTKTGARDRGRDLSVELVRKDPLSGTDRKQVIIQCRHWLEDSIGMEELTKLQNQMEHWEPDILIIATSGRFTTDAVEWIEENNEKDTKLTIKMWPESHLEKLLNTRPHIIANFDLR